MSKGIAIPQPGDENVYYYMGKLISEGKSPYADFFYAHPPLHIYLLALIYKIFGFNIAVLKSVPLISILISALFIFKMTKEKFGEAESLLASLLFLFSYGALFNSVFSFGINTAAMFLVIGIYFLINRNNYALAGIFFGFSSITRLLTLIPISIILIAVLFSEDFKKFAPKVNFLTYFLIIFLGVNMAFFLFFGNAYLISVYKYHFMKSPGGGENFKEYIDIIKLNWILFSSAMLFIFLKDRKTIGLFAAVSAAYLIFLASLKKIFGFYFIIAFPFLAIVGGCSIVNIFPKKFFLKRIFLSLFLLIFIWNLASDIMFLEKIGFRGFERGKEMAEFIKSNSNKGTLLFGDDSVAPLLALMTGKKIALDFADTNNQVFITGIRNIKEVLGNLKGKDILFVIRSRQGISYFSEVKEFLNKDCGLLSSFHDEMEGDYIVYKCK